MQHPQLLTLSISILVYLAQTQLTNAQIMTHHPINITIKTKTDLPLLNGKMTCNTCHTHAVDQKLLNRRNIKDRGPLQKEYSKLCESCHKEKTVHAFSHINDINKFKKGSKEVVTCNNCHAMHFADKKLIVLQGANLCLSCHEKQKKLPHKTAIIVKGSTDVYLNGDHLTCQTCHRTHGRSHDKHFLADDPSHIMDFCAFCHGDSAPKLYKAYHSILLKDQK